jgi:hypothetical protein
MTFQVHVDAEGAVKDWINANAALTSGDGRPLTLGAHLNRMASIRGTYAHLVLINTSSGMTAETPVGIARISATVYGQTKSLAQRGAMALANELETIKHNARPVSMGTGAVCLMVDNITGPAAVDDTETTREQWRYLVDSDYHLIPA